jgi:hypothetical protein
VKKVPAHFENESVDESPIIRDLRKLVDASRHLREDLTDLLAHRPRMDLRAAVEAQQQRNRRRLARTTRSDDRVRTKRA